MCSGPGEGALLVWDSKTESVIHLKWKEATKKLHEVTRVQVPGEWVKYMCYMPQAELVILSRPEEVVQGVKIIPGNAPVWELHGKKITPEGVSCDAEGRVYVGNGYDGKVWVVNGFTGEIIQEIKGETGMGAGAYKVCCLSNPSQLLVNQELGHTVLSQIRSEK